MQITVWKSDFESDSDPAYRVSVCSTPTEEEVLSAHHTHQQAWDRAIAEAERRQLVMVDEIDGDSITCYAITE